MIGWSITVTRITPEEYPLKLNRDAVLATWKVGAMGTYWLDKLVAVGKARRVKSGGYPDIYTAPVESIVPLLLGHELPSDEDVPTRKPHEITIERDKLATCSPDETLTIVVWDQS